MSSLQNKTFSFFAQANRGQSPNLLFDWNDQNFIHFNIFPSTNYGSRKSQCQTHFLSSLINISSNFETKKKFLGIYQLPANYSVLSWIWNYDKQSGCKWEVAWGQQQHSWLVLHSRVHASTIKKPNSIITIHQSFWTLSFSRRSFTASNQPFDTFHLNHPLYHRWRLFFKERNSTFSPCKEENLRNFRQENEKTRRTRKMPPKKKQKINNTSRHSSHSGQ